MKAKPARNSFPKADSAWRRPAGVAPGTWDYVHSDSIANHYDAFIDGAAVCDADLAVVTRIFPAIRDAAIGSTECRRPMIADFGCGTGRAADRLATAGYRVAAIDLSTAMLSRVRRRIATSPPAIAHRIHPIHANLVQLDGLVDDQFAGGVCLFATLGMIADRASRRRFLDHARRTIVPGGPMVIHVHHRWAAMHDPGGLRVITGDFIWGDLLRRRVAGDRRYAYRGIDQMFMHTFTRGELKRDLAAAGWQIRETIWLDIQGHPAPARRIGRAPGGMIVVAA